MYRLIRLIHQRLPVAPHRKEVIKSHLYTHFPRLFSHSLGYRNWLRRMRWEDEPPEAPRPVAPGREAWAALAAERSTRATGRSDDPFVVVPVYRGYDETLACLYSVLRAKPLTQLVVVNDASPDSPLVERLEDLARDGLLTLQHHPTNLGFAGAVNTGMGVYPERDVVLLNSDTQVFGDWLWRLQHAARARPDIGTATPLSNNAEICSYPEPLVDNRAALELEDASLDSLAAGVNRGCTVEAPTAVGFCMYIRRACLVETGLFDRAFGRGYGEENDFCLRATALGWKHVIAGDVFVRHIGSVSFEGEAKRHRARAEALLHKRFRGYGREIADYIERDPVQPLRVNLDIARLVKAAPHRKPRKTLLFVTHGWGGGIERHIEEMRQCLESEQMNVYLLRPDEEAREACVAISHPSVRLSPNLKGLPVGSDQTLLVDALRRLGIDHLHVHSLAGFGDEAPDWIPQLSERLGCLYDVTLHDYMPLCPRVDFIGRGERYCGEPELASCERCVRKLGTPFGRPSVALWRERWRHLLGGARRVFCPSQDVVERIRRSVPEARLCLRPHPERIERAGASDRPGAAEAAVHRNPGRRRVAVIGAIGPQKGAGLLLGCAQDAAARDLPLEFCLVGFSDRDDALHRTGRVEITGGYDDADLLDRLTELDCELCFLTSIGPETYGYTLSAAFLGRLYPVAFAIGAAVERVAQAGWGRILPLVLQGDPAAVNDALLATRIPALPPALERGWKPHSYPSLARDYYEGFSDRDASTSPSAGPLTRPQEG